MQQQRSIDYSIPSRLALVVWLVSLVGCVDGPLFQLKKLNPVIQHQWRQDRERGPVFSQRMEEIAFRRSRFAKVSDEEQKKWIGEFKTMLDEETSPEIRRATVLALGEVMNQPEAVTEVVRLAQDKNEKVRLVVAQALRKHSTPETTQTLLAMAASDKSQSVRLSATESLGKHQTEEVKQFLAKQLNDRSPAMQYHASLALKDFTGKDFKGDVGLWKRYLAGEEVEPPVPTLAESIQSYIPFKR